MNLSELVEKYIIVRDKKASLKADYEAKVSVVDQAMEKIEALILSSFAESGTESCRTESGTAYKTTRLYANVADWDIALEHIKRTENWSMLEKRVSKKAVEEYMEANEEAPPGVSTRTEVVINVRRS